MFTLLLLVVLIVLLLVQFAAASPLDDLLGGLFGDSHPPAVKGRRAKVRSHSVIPAGAGGSLLAVAQGYVGARNWTGVGRWCGAAMSTWATRATGRRYDIIRARDWAHVGRPTTARVGAVAVLQSHVGVVAGWTPRGPLLLSGNHNHHVGYGVYPASRIIAYREVD